MLPQQRLVTCAAAILSHLHQNSRVIMESRKYVTLSTGGKMPFIGLGTFQSAVGEVGRAVEAALDTGYRHIDCAWFYQNEHEIGDAIEKKVKEGVVKREDLFICTKLFPGHITDSTDTIVNALKDSLSKLKLDYVDMYLIHAPIGRVTHDFSAGQDNVFAWKGMEACMDNGLTKSIGLSNFNSKQIQEIWDSARIKPSNLQVERHVYFQQKKLYDFCKKKNMVMTAYAPIGSPGSNNPGVVSTSARPQILQNEVLKKIGAKHNKTVAQVCLRFHIQSGVVAIPKSVTPSRIQQNFDVFDFCLTEEEMAEIQKLDCGVRYFGFEKFKNNPCYPFNEEF